MSVELLLADNDCLRKQLANAKKQLSERDRKVSFLQQQLSLVRTLVRDIDAILLTLAAKLHDREIVLVHNRHIRLDSKAFHDLMSEVGDIKAKVQRLHDALQPREAEATQGEAARLGSSGSSSRGCRSPLVGGSWNLTVPAPLRKQISWDPSTQSSPQPGPSGACSFGSQRRLERQQSQEADDHDDETNVGSDSGSDGSESLQDGILASASAGMIGLKTLQLFSKRSDSEQGPQSRRWYNKLRCCTFQECAIVIHLIYLHLISIVAVGGVTFLIVGIMLDKRECLVAGTVMVIASYGLFLNHCFYRSAAVSSRPAAQKLRIKDQDSIDLEASTNETINIDLTRPPTRNILQVDLDSSQLSRAY